MRFVWLTHISLGKLRIPVYLAKKRTEFYIEHETPRDFAYGNYKQRGYTSTQKDEKVFCMVWHNCSVWGLTVLAKTEEPKNSYNLHSLP